MLFARLFLTPQTLFSITNARKGETSLRLKLLTLLSHGGGEGGGDFEFAITNQHNLLFHVALLKFRVSVSFKNCSNTLVSPFAYSHQSHGEISNHTCESEIDYIRQKLRF